MASLESTITIEQNEYRPCKWGKERRKGIFHRWIDTSYVVAPSVMIGGDAGGVVRYTRALVEDVESGLMHEVSSEHIKFCDTNRWMEYMWLGDPIETSPSKIGEAIGANFAEGMKRGLRAKSGTIEDAAKVMWDEVMGGTKKMVDDPKPDVVHFCKHHDKECAYNNFCQYLGDKKDGDGLPPQYNDPCPFTTAHGAYTHCSHYEPIYPLPYDGRG